MGRIPLHPPAKDRDTSISNALPEVLQTPGGLAVLEIQGTLNSSTGLDDDAEGRHALPIGRLSFPLYDASKPAGDTAWHKRVHLYIGENQRLTGEVKKLANPLAVIQRRSQAQADEELEIADIIHFRLLFAHRPEPVGAAAKE